MIALSSPPVERDSSKLVDQVRARLQESGHPSLRQLTVVETQGVVVVTGRVASFYLKQLVQSLAGAVDGVEQVCNQTVVTLPHVDGLLNRA